MSRMRETWADLRGSAVDVAKRIHPAVLFGVGLVVVAVLFGAFALVGGSEGLDDLGLGSPGGRPSEADGPRGDGAGAEATDDDGLTDGLAARSANGSTTTPRGPSAAPGPGTTGPDPTASPLPTGSAGVPASAAAGGSTTTSDPAPSTTAPAPATTAPETTTTAPPDTTDPGLIGGLLDVLGLGGS